MSTLERKAIERAAIGKLKMTSDKKRQDHPQLKFIHEGRVVGKIHFSHTPKMKTIGPELVKKLAAQMNVDVPFFVEVVSCTKSREDYIRRVSQ